jgi:hypothetical protein
MKLNTGAIALVTAGATLLIARLPSPDPARLRHAASSLASDTGAGLHALAFEGAAFWKRHQGALEFTGLEPRMAAGVLALSIITVATVAIVIVVLGFRRGHDDDAGFRPRQLIAPRSTDRRVARARALTSQGGMNIDVARRTTLSRDAVDLLSRVHRPDRIAGRGRTFRRSPARRSVA